jgi:hypothetical protein
LIVKVRITHLKAPWPSGFGVGDVIDVDAITPALAGKCEPVADAAPEFLTNPERTEFQATQPSDEREALREALMDRGITPDNRWGIARLQSELAKVKA